MDVMIHARKGQFFDDHYDMRPLRPPPMRRETREILQSEPIETMQSKTPANCSDILVTRVALGGVIALQMFP